MATTQGTAWLRKVSWNVSPGMCEIYRDSDKGVGIQDQQGTKSEKHRVLGMHKFDTW